jgi:hypothetical protein
MNVTLLPQYQSHKVVHAAKIVAVEVIEQDGAGRLTLAPIGAAEIAFQADVDAAYMKKHTPQPGGYFVAYADGYLSFSPAEAFESGYTPLVEAPTPTPEPKLPELSHAPRLEMFLRAIATSATPMKLPTVVQVPRDGGPVHLRISTINQTGQLSGHVRGNVFVPDPA